MTHETSTFSARYCRFISRWAVAVLVVALAAFVGALVLVSRLELRTAFSELLPSDDPGVVALQKTQERMGDLSLLLVGIHSPDPQANLRYAEALTARFGALPPEICAFATYHIRDIKGFFERNKWLYLPEDDLTTIRDRLRKEITQRKNPLLVDLGDDEDESVDALKNRIGSRAKFDGRFPNGVFSNKDGTYVWVAALPPGGIFGEKTGEDLFRAAHDIVNQSSPASFHPGLRTQILGPVATAVANRQAVERDIVWVTAICIAVVALSILLYFRSLRAIPFVGIPAVLGTVMAFAVAQLAFGYVNSSTAFLGSIIVGNGINYAIILLARYREERNAGASVPESVERTVAGVVRGTGVAAICASAAYASLMLTSFRGFYQFGVMGAVGVIFCWLATFTVLPVLFFLTDRRHIPLQLKSRPTFATAAGRFITRRAGLILIVSLVLTGISIRGVAYFAETPFEYDFNKLKARLPTTAESQAFDRSQSDLFGRWPQPTIILADDIAELPAIRKAIHRQDELNPGRSLIGQVVTVFDVLPGTPEVQQRKLELIADIRKLVSDPAVEALEEKERKELAAIDPPADLRVLLPDDLPPLAKRPFTEADGSVGRVVLVYLIEQGISVWNGRDLLKIASVLQRLELPEHGKTLETSGNAVVFSSMLRSILHDGPIATIASLLVVVILILIIMRPLRAAGIALVSLAAGVVWMVGAAGWAEVKITFLNFIALPITFGIGAEYALNVVARYQEDKDMARSVTSTGVAVALCSWTTIVGYGSLLAARNRALQGFGALAILGEVACLLTAVVSLPAFVLWWQRRKKAAPASGASS